MSDSTAFFSNGDRKLTRRGFLGVSTAALACGAGAHAASRPNVVVILFDDAGWRDVGYHGSEIQTPNINRVAREGVELNHFYVCPTCSPTRASMLTGRPASRFGILTPIAGRSTHALPSGVLTLASLFRDNGYDTAISGKWHLGLRPEVGPLKYGFAHSYGYLHGQIDPYTHLYKNGDRTWHRNDQLIEEEGHATDLITAEAGRSIRSGRDRSRPFFLYVTYSVPHTPLAEANRWTERYQAIAEESRRLFAASMTHMDDCIAQLLAVLRDEGLEEDTIVFFSSDNGGQQQEAGEGYGGKFRPSPKLGDNRPLRGWKGELYEGGIRVPAAVRWPGHLKPRKEDQALGAWDVLPTLASMTGLTLPETAVEGVNAWDAIRTGSQVQERVLYWRTPDEMAVRKGRWKLIHHGASLANGTNELFDLVADPYESKDLAADNAPLVRELAEELGRQRSKD